MCQNSLKAKKHLRTPMNDFNHLLKNFSQVEHVSFPLLMIQLVTHVFVKTVQHLPNQSSVRHLQLFWQHVSAVPT